MAYELSMGNHGYTANCREHLLGQSSGSHHFNLPGYELVRNLGKGSYGRVELAQQISTGNQVAIKIIDKCRVTTVKHLDRLRKEIRILCLLSHPHIVKMLQVVETNESIMMIMEYVSEGELFDYISRKRQLNEKEARKVFRQILSAIDYCHENCIIHRDLKPENILLDSNLSVKMADFGFASVFGHRPYLDTYCGSPFYASPEMVSGIPYKGPEVDVWSLGVILYVMLVGRLPFQHTDKVSYDELIEYPSSLSQASVDLMQRMLQIVPKSRATISEIKKHVWTTAFGMLATPQNFLPDRQPLVNFDSKIFNFLVKSTSSSETLENILYSPFSHPIKSEYYLLLEKKNKDMAEKGKHGGMGRFSKFWSKCSTFIFGKSTRSENLHRRYSVCENGMIEAYEGGRRNSLPPTLQICKIQPGVGTNMPLPRSVNSISNLWTMVDIPAFRKERFLDMILKDLISILSKLSISFYMTSGNPFKLACRTGESCEGSMIFSLEIVHHRKKEMYGLEGKRNSGGSLVFLMNIMSSIRKHWPIDKTVY